MTMRSPRSTVLLAGCFAALMQTAPGSQARDTSVPAKQYAVGTASIAGVVVTDEQQPRSLRRVMVMLAETGGAIMTRMATTNEAGRFAFSELPPGRYTITARLPPYLLAAYGSRRVAGPGANQTGTAIVLSSGQAITGLSIALMRSAVITGTVRDVDGSPARGNYVNVWYFRRSPTGERVLMSYYSQDMFTSAVDDRGVYRIFGLPPGEYLVSSSTPVGRFEYTMTTDADVQRALELIQRPGAGAPSAPGTVVTHARRPTVGYVPVYYPGTTVSGQATWITLGVGEEHDGVDFQLQRVPTSRIEGSVLTADGQPAARIPLRVATTGPTDVYYDFGRGFGVLGATATSDDAGRFTLFGLVPGDYQVQAFTRPSAQGAPASWGMTPVTIAGEDLRVSLTMQPAGLVTGRVMFEATAERPPQDLSKVRISLIAASAMPGFVSLSTVATVQPTGEFSIAGVVPGRYRLTGSLGAPAVQGPWALKSARLKGQESLDVPVEIRAGDSVTDATVTFFDRPTELSGRMTDAANRPAPEYFIIVFAKDPADWAPGTRRIMLTRPALDGQFSFKNLPPGDYRLAAVTDVQQNEHLDPEFLRQLVDASIPLTLAPSEKKVQDIRLR